MHIQNGKMIIIEAKLTNVSFLTFCLERVINPRLYSEKISDSSL